MSLDSDAGSAPEQDAPAESIGDDPRRIGEALAEMDCDVDRWLLVLPSFRGPEARALLRQVGHWVVLCSADHDGVVACYRTLKGLTDLRRPQLSLAVLDARGEAEAGKIFHKLAGVCEQFLRWPLSPEPAVTTRPDVGVAQHVVMTCRAAAGQHQLWQIVSEFLAEHRASPSPVRVAPVAQSTPSDVPIDPRPGPAASVAMSSTPQPDTEPVMQQNTEPQLTTDPTQPDATDPDVAHTGQNQDEDVIDLPDTDYSESAILGAVLRRESGALVECPAAARPPMCSHAALAVARDRRLILLCVARQGLSDLRTIGQAYRWLTENRALVAMALPQLHIDPHAMPGLRLLVDHADATADLLQPLLQIGNVTVQTYRKLRWGQRTGLLLEAA